MRSDTPRRIIGQVKFILTLATIAYVAHCLVSYLTRGGQASEPTETTVTVYDTITYFVPIARDSVVVRYETRRLPVDTTANVGREDNFLTKNDSADVIIPITQKEYQDSTYHVWISGYAANLDSIHTFTRHDHTTLTLLSQKSKRWHLGITVGMAITPKGVQPYLGAGLTYSFKSF